MKKISLFYFIVLTLLFCSCERSFKTTIEPTTFQIENMHKDILFQEVLLEIHSLYNNTLDFELLKEYLEDNEISKNEERNIHTIFGYTDQNQYFDDLTKQKKRILQLDNRYNLKSRTNSVIMVEVEKAFLELDHFQLTQPSYAALQNCESIRRNCIASVAAEATVMHVGCGLLDLTVLAGIACHGAAIVYQWSAGNNCNLEADHCNEAQRIKVVKIPGSR